MSDKGYVVRGKDKRGGPAFALSENGGFGGASEDDIPAHVFSSLDAAAGARAHMLRYRCTDVRIFAVAEDGTETPLPTYEEALALCDAWKALAKAREATLRARPNMPGEIASLAVSNALKALADLGVPYRDTLGEPT